MPAGKGKPAGGYRAGAKGSYGCDGFPTVSADGTVHGCHPTKARAAAQARAIWASTARKSLPSLEKAMVAEGDFVIFNNDEDEIEVGRVEYVMTEGIFGLSDSEYSIKATAEDPVLSIRCYENEDGIWEEQAYSVGVRSSEVVKIESIKVWKDSLVEMLSSNNGTSIIELSIPEEMSKAAKPKYEDMIKPRSGGSTPSNPKLYSRVVQAAKDKFDVYPSAVANSWVVQEYKRRGGTYKSESKSTTKSIWGGAFDPLTLEK
jgi:hypothetical protein